MMTEYSVIWTDGAYESLLRAHDYIRNSTAKGAKKVVRELVKYSQTLSTLPYRYPIDPTLDTAPVEYRFLLKWHYKVIYTVLEAEQIVLIVLVFDSRQDPAKLKI